MGQKKKRKRGKESVKSVKKRCTEESLSERRKTPQNIVQDEPVEKGEEPCMTSAGRPLEKKSITKGKRKISSKNADKAPNKRGRMVETKSGKDVTSETKLSGSAKNGSSHQQHKRVRDESGEKQHKRKKTSDTQDANKRSESDKSISQAPAGVSGAQTTSPPDSVAAPLALECFTFHRKLGEGGFGKVMLATHTVSGHQLAIKMVKKRELVEFFKNNIHIERDILEITGGSTLFTHAYGTFLTADYACYAMEYLSGGDLTEFIKSRAPLDVCTTRFLAAEILSGIQFLHNRGIIHRDLKPENILLDSDGHAKIADFGLAVKNVFGCKMIREFVGSLGYMAPEVLWNKLYNYTADLFSFGVIVYQMATRSFPFYAGQPRYPENIDPHIRDILQRLLQKSPSKRQDDCDNLKRHPFFCSINWEEIETGRSHPPFTMRPTPVMDTSDIIELHQVMSNAEAQKPPITPEDERLFCGFSYVSDRWKSIQSHNDNSKARMKKSPPSIPDNN